MILFKTDTSVILIMCMLWSKLWLVMASLCVIGSEEAGLLFSQQCLQRPQVSYYDLVATTYFVMSAAYIEESKYK
jgi:hypothetical protein